MRTDPRHSPRGPTLSEPPTTPEGRRLLGAMLVSLLVHVVAGTLLLAHPGGSGRPAPPTWETPPPPPETVEKVSLGSDRSTATSITWIGFDEYQEHVLREKSAVDQPELALDSTAGNPAPPSPPPSPQAPPEIAQSEVAKLPIPTATPVITQDAAPMPPSEDIQVAEGEPALGDWIGPVVTEADPQDLEKSVTAADAGEVGPPAPEAPAQPPAPPFQVPVERPPQPVTPSGAPNSAAQAADRESDAAATITAPVARLGQPLTSKGLEIRTVRPRFTYYTQLTASPRNPTVRVQFDREGKVFSAQIVRSSGVGDIDRPVLDAIYQWRATGKQLEQLPAGNPPETLTIEIRILL